MSNERVDASPNPYLRLSFVVAGKEMRLNISLSRLRRRGP